jgi:predicted metal-dependent peptidase
MVYVYSIGYGKWGQQQKREKAVMTWQRTMYVSIGQYINIYNKRVES